MDLHSRHTLGDARRSQWQRVMYQTLRSVSDNHVFVVCRDGGFYELPDHARHRGPWQGMHRGEIANLNPKYWLDIELLAREMRARGA